MKLVQYYVVLLFYNNLKKKKEKGVCTFQNFRREKHFCKVWKNDFMLFVQLVLMT